jgi:hypothetical protein
MLVAPSQTSRTTVKQMQRKQRILLIRFRQVAINRPTSPDLEGTTSGRYPTAAHEQFDKERIR